MKLFSYIIIIAFFALQNISECSADQQIRVVATVSPIDAFTKIIGGDDVSAFSIVPPSYSHESFEPKLNDLSKMTDCQLIISTGHSSMLFEKKILDFNKKFSKNGGAKLLNLSSLFPDSEEDPHFWTSPKRVIEISKEIKTELQNIEPEKAELFENNFLSFSQKIKSLEQDIQLKLSSKSQRTFISYHSSWYFFAKDYNLTQIALEKNGKEPSLAFLTKTIKLTKEQNLQALVYEPYAPKSSIELLLEQSTMKSLQIDPSAKNWLENLNNLINFLESNM